MDEAEARGKEIIDALNQKGVNRPCPRCGNNSFSTAGETLLSLQDLSKQPAAFVIGGQSIPAAIVICDRCGYITQHALVPLGVKFGGK